MKRARNCFNFPFNCNFGYARHVEHRKGGTGGKEVCETKTETARKGKEEKRNGWKQPSLCIILIQLQPVQCLHNFCRQRRDENITEWSLTSFQAGERGLCAREGSEGGALSREPKLSKSAKLLLLVVGFGLRVAHSFMAHLLVNLNFTHTQTNTYIYIRKHVYIYTHPRTH